MIPVIGVQYCEVTGDQTPAFTLRGVLKEPAQIARGVVLSSVLIDVKVYRIDNAMEYVGKIAGAVDITRSNAAEAEALLGARSIIAYNRAHAALGSPNASDTLSGSLNASDALSGSSKASDTKMEISVYAALMFDTMLDTYEVHATVSMESDFVSALMLTELGSCKTNTSSAQEVKGLVSGDMSVTVPDIARFKASITGWSKCRVRSEDSAVLHVLLTVGELTVKPPGIDAALVVSDVTVILDGYPRWDPGPLLQSSATDSDNSQSLLGKNETMYIFDDVAKFKQLGFKATISGTINLKHSTGLPQFDMPLEQEITSDDSAAEASSPTQGALPEGVTEGAVSDKSDEQKEAEIGTTAVASVTLRFGGGEAHVVEEVHVNASVIIADYTPGLAYSLKAQVAFSYPCLAGDAIKFNAQFSLDLTPIQLEATAQIIFYCGAVAPTPIAEITASIDKLVLEGIEMFDITFEGTIFQRTTNGVEKTYIEGLVKGTIQGISAWFSFDTHTGNVRAGVDAIKVEYGPLIIEVRGGASIAGDACDYEQGNFVKGNLSFITEIFQFAGNITGKKNCANATVLREAGIEIAPMAPIYNSAVSLFTDPGDRFPLCAGAGGLCGPWFGHKVCPAGETCDSTGTCQSSEALSASYTQAALGGFNKLQRLGDYHLGAASSADGIINYAAFSNNYKGTCSRCSADMLCGEEAGYTVCSGRHACVQGQCELTTSIGAEQRKPLDDARQFSFNYGVVCPLPGCAWDDQCGPKHEGLVCRPGMVCSVDGTCSTQAGDSDGEMRPFSNNYDAACPLKDGAQRRCARDMQCGENARDQVCMSGQTCVDGLCLSTYATDLDSYAPEKIMPSFSENYEGVCMRCAGGVGKFCGGPKRLVCSKSLVCAKVPPGTSSTAAAAPAGGNATVDPADEVTGGGVNANSVSSRLGEAEAQSQTTSTTTGTSVMQSESTLGDHLPAMDEFLEVWECMTAARVAELEIPDDREHVFAATVKEQTQECERPDLVSVPIFYERMVNADGTDAVPTSKDTHYQLTCAVGVNGKSSGAACGASSSDSDGLAYAVCPADASCALVKSIRDKTNQAPFLDADLSDAAFVCILDTDFNSHKKDSVGLNPGDLFAYQRDDDVTKHVCTVDADSGLIQSAPVVREINVLPGSATLGKTSNSTENGGILEYYEAVLLCGPRTGGLICSGADKVCDAVRGVCTPDTYPTEVLEEYSSNYGEIASADMAKAIAKKMGEHTPPVNLYLDLSNVIDRDYPEYAIQIAIPRASLKLGVVELGVENLVMTAYGTPAGNDTRFWDGELTATIKGVVNGVEGSFTTTTAWKYPPNGELEVLPVYVRGELTGSFGGEIVDGNISNPAMTLKMLASFVVPCDAGVMFTASGSVSFDMDAFTGFATAAGSFVCGVGDAGGKLAEISAQMRAPIKIAQLIRIESVSVHVVIIQAPRAEIAAGKYYLVGTLSGIVSIPPIADLTLFGSVRFDTKARTATIIGSIVYEHLPTVAIDATVMVRVGAECKDEQIVGNGRVDLSVGVLERMEARASVRRNCVPSVSEEGNDRYNWAIALHMPTLRMFGGGFVASNVAVSLGGIEGVSDSSTGAGSLLWNLDASGSFATNTSAMASSGYDLGALKRFDCNGDFHLNILDVMGSGSSQEGQNSTGRKVSSALNVSCSISVGGDDGETPAIFAMVANGSVTYPMIRKSHFTADASINELGGENGLTVASIILQITMEVDDGDDLSPEMTIFGSADGVQIAGVNIGQFSISAQAYKIPAAVTGLSGITSSGSLGSGLGVVLGGNSTSTQGGGLYWKGVITADVGLPLEKLEVDGSALITFNTLTNELSIAFTLDISVGGFTLMLTGEHGSECSDIGFIYTGSLTFPADSDWPLDLHKKNLTMSVTKYCKPEAAFVYVMKGSLVHNTDSRSPNGFGFTDLTIEVRGKVRHGSESYRRKQAAINSGDSASSANNTGTAAELGEADVPLADIDWGLDFSGGVTYGNDGTQDLPRIVPAEASFFFDFHVDYMTPNASGATAKFMNALLDMEVAVLWDLGNGGSFDADAAFSVPCAPGPNGGLTLNGLLKMDNDLITIDQASAFAHVACKNLAEGDVVLNISASSSKISLGGGVFSVLNVSISIEGKAPTAIADVTLATIKDDLNYKFDFSGTVALGEDAKYGSFLAEITYEDTFLEIVIDAFTLIIPKDDMRIELKGRALLRHTRGSGKMCSAYGDFTVEGSIQATNVPWGQGTTIDLPRLYAKYTWDCDKLFRLEITLDLWEQGYKYYTIGDSGFAAALPKSASLVIDKTSATEAGFIHIEIEITSNCALSVMFLLSGLKFQYAQVECLEGSVCSSMEDLSKSLVKCKEGDDGCDCSDGTCESALKNANLCAKLEGSNIFFKAMQKVVDKMQYSYIGLRLMKTTKGVTVAGVVRGVPLVIGVVDLELGFSVHLSDSEPRFHVYATLSRAANVPEDGGSMSLPIPEGANEVTREMMERCGTLLDKLFSMLSTIQSVSVAYTTHPMLSIPEAEQALFNPDFRSFQSGFSFVLILDVLAGTDFISVRMRELLEKLGPDPSLPAPTLDKKTLKTKVSEFIDVASKLPLTIPVGDEICLRCDFNMGPDGVGIGPDMVYLSFTPFLCLKASSMSTGIEIKQRVIFDNGRHCSNNDDGNEVCVAGEKKKMMIRTSFAVSLTAAGVGLVAKAAATLEESDFIINPMWMFPKGGIVFPLSIGLGISVTWAGIPALLFLELEGGLFGCSLKAQIASPEETAALGGTLPSSNRFEQTDSFPTPFGRTRAATLGADVAGGYDDPTVIKACASGYERGDDIFEENAAGEEVFVRVGDCLPAMPLGAEGVTCIGFDSTGGEDPYGRDPAVIKVALSVDVVMASFAASFTISNFFLGRLVLMIFAIAPSTIVGQKITETLLMFRPLLDLVNFDSIEMSINSLPFPKRLYSGTVIPASIFGRITNLNLFNFLIVKEASIFIDPWKGKFAAKLWVAPFKINVLGVELLAVSGVPQDLRMRAKERISEAQIAMAEKEKVEEAAYQSVIESRVTERAAFGADDEVESLCEGDADTCNTCATAKENEVLRISCHGPQGKYVISEILDVSWSETSVSAVALNFDPGKCGADDLGGRTQSDQEKLKRYLLKKQYKRLCVGKPVCEVAQTVGELGEPTTEAASTNTITRKPVVGNIVVKCQTQVAYEENNARTGSALYSADCADGECKTCGRGRSSGGADGPLDMFVQCMPGGFIWEVVDAAMESRDTAPPWDRPLVEGICPDIRAPMSESTNANACIKDRSDVLLATRRLCIGKTECLIPSVDIPSLVESGDAVACDGRPMLLSLIIKCLPLSIPAQINSNSEVTDSFAGVFDQTRDVTFPLHTMSISQSKSVSTARAYFFLGDKPKTLAFGSLGATANHTELIEEVKAIDDSALDNERTEYTQEEMTFIQTTSGLASTPRNLTSIRFASAAFAESSHWLAARLQLGARTRGGQGSYWRFRIVGDVKQFKKLGGFFSITTTDMKKEFCISADCNLESCTSDDFCEISVKLLADSEYLIQAFGMGQHDAQSADALVSLEFKPPTQCLFRVCDVPNDINSCELVSGAALPWSPVSSNEYPEMECSAPTGAEVVSIKSETKPFCLLPVAYRGNLKECWPKPVASNDSESCHGLHDALTGESTNTVVASLIEKAGVDFLITGGNHAANGNDTAQGEQRCVPLYRTGKGNEVRKARCALMDIGFDETSCGSNAESPSTPDSTSIPGVTLDCGAVVIPSSDTPAKFSEESAAIRYALDVDSVTGISEDGLLESGDVMPDASVIGFDPKSRRGKYAYDFRRLAPNENGESMDTSRTSFLVVPELKPATDIADPGSILLWFRKDSAALEDNDSTQGETIATLLPSGLLYPSPDDGSLNVDSGKTGDASRVTMGLSRGGVLWLRVYSSNGSLRCGVKAPRVKTLTEGAWHHIGFVMKSEPLRPWYAATVDFFIDGGVSSVTCPNPSIGGAPMSYTVEKTAEHRTLLIGVDYVTAVNGRGKFQGALDGSMDDFEVFGQALTTADVAMLSVTIPCARGFVGEGFTFFDRVLPSPDGTPAPPSTISLKPNGRGFAACAKDIYTISFRYLRSTGNNHQLQLVSGEGDSSMVLGNATFREPIGFSDVDVVTWSHSNPIVVDLREDAPRKFSLSDIRLEMDWAQGEAVRKRRRTLLEDSPSATDEETDLEAWLKAKDVEERKEERAKIFEDATAEGILEYVASDGPLIDSYSMDTGASYLRASMLERSWHEAFQSVQKTYLDTEPTNRFCKGIPTSSGNLVSALDRCNLYGDSINSPTSMRGNVMLQTSVVIACEYAAEWGVRATGFGFKGRIELMKLGEVIAYIESTPAESDIGTSRQVMETTFSLTPGAHTFYLYGVYSSHEETLVRGSPESSSIEGPAAETTPDEEHYGVPQLLFKQEKYCGMTSFMKFEVGSLNCTFAPPEETDSAELPPYVYRPPAYEKVVPDTESESIIEGDEATTSGGGDGEGETKRSNSEFDGLYFSMAIDPSALFGAGASSSAALGITASGAIESANHFVAQGSMQVLGNFMSLDIVIAVGDKSQPEGSAARKGGISMLTYFKWTVPGTDILLGTILATFDFTPFDFDLLTKEGLKEGFKEITIAFSLEIVPTMVNKLMAVAGDLIKVALKLVLWPIITIAAEAMDILNDAADLLEERIQEFKVTYESTKEELERIVGDKKDQINAKRQELMETRSELSNLDPKINEKRRICDEPCRLDVGWCCAGCTKYWGNTCVWASPGHPTAQWVPSGCGGREIARLAACASHAFWVTAKSAAEHLLDLVSEALQVLMNALQSLMDAVLAILQVAEKLMMAAKEALLAAAMVIGIMVMPLKFIDAFRPCIGCAKIDQVCFWNAFDTVPLIAIHTFSVMGSFSMAAVAFDAVIDFMILGTSKQISISFSLDAASLLRSFGEFCASFFGDLMDGQSQGT